MLYIKCLGAFLILISALGLSRYYESFCLKKHKECKLFLSFCERIRKNISDYLLPRSRWCECVDATFEGAGGFFSRLASGVDIKDAYEMSYDKLLLPEDIRSEMHELFSELGRGYMKDEVARLDEMIGKLKKCETELKEEARRESKAGKALILAIALGIVILLL